MNRIEVGLAKCNRCGTTFEWIHGRINSTKESPKADGVYPKCPYCSSYRETVAIKYGYMEWVNKEAIQV